MVRSLLRGAREKALIAAGLPGRARRIAPGHLAILAYHNIVPDGEKPTGDRSLHLRFSDFREQLDFLQGHFDLVALSHAHSLGPDRQKPAVAITFDDAYWGALRLGLPELHERQIPATVFVCPGLLGDTGFWWDRLSLPEKGMDPRVRRKALRNHQGMQERILAEFGDRSVPEDLRPARPEELDEVAEFPSVSFASHTWAHPNLQGLEPESLVEELTTSRDWLSKRYPEKVLEEHISFPYGLFDDRVIEIAEDLGFGYLYRIEGGRSPLPISAPSILPRLNIPAGISIGGFELRVSGVLG